MAVVLVALVWLWFLWFSFGSDDDWGSCERVSVVGWALAIISHRGGIGTLVELLTAGNQKAKALKQWFVS